MNGMKLTKFSSLLFLILMISCAEKNQPSQEVSNYDLSAHLISCEQFLAKNQETYLLVDLRKKEAYDAGHIPGAVNIWRPQITDTSYPYGGMRASASQLEELLASLGANKNDTIIVYDDNGGVDALRLVWMLKYYGFESVCLLDGGLNVWNTLGKETQTASPNYALGNFQLDKSVSKQMLAEKLEMEQALKDERIQIIDARNEEEYSGKRQKKGASRAGHIPGAKLIDFYHNIDYSTMKLKSAKELEAFYSEQGLTKDKTTIIYCQSGVRSAQTSFVLSELLKFPNVKNYDGSWIEWSYDNELPIVQDSITVIFE
jgi:thiosulfate/3-mercaptopyruvate sulfurtransferase